MLRIGLGVCLVSVRLSCLRKQDEWRGIGCLETERKVEQNKRVDVELGKSEDIQANPDRNHNRL
jgi:dihydroneopterin aldolase